MELSNKLIEKISINPLAMEKEINEIFSSHDKYSIIYLFENIKTDKFYNYLIDNGYNVYFSSIEVITLLDNYNFLVYLFNVSPEIFNSIDEKNYTKTFIYFIENNIDSLINIFIDIYSNKTLVNNKIIFEKIVDSAKNINDFTNLLNNINDNELLEKVIKRLNKKKIKLDPTQLNENLFINVELGKYLVFNCNLDNIKYLKNESYKECYKEVVNKIKSGELNLNEYTIDNFPMDLRTKSVFDALSFNKKYYNLLNIFPLGFHDTYSDFRIYLNSNEEIQKEIFNKYTDDLTFFRLYVANIDNLIYEKLYNFNYVFLDEDAIKILLEAYYNSKIKEFLCNLKYIKIPKINLIYKYLIKNEIDSNNLKRILKNIKSNYIDYEILDLIFEHISLNNIAISDIPDNFYDQNLFLNYCIENNKLVNYFRFRSKAYKIDSAFKEPQIILNNIECINEDIIKLYLLSYFNKENIKDNKEIKQLEKELLKKLELKTDKKIANILLYMFIEDKRNVYSFKYLNTEKEIYAILNYGDIENRETSDLINTMNMMQLQLINKKHIRTIYNLINNLDINNELALMLSIKMYLVIGFDCSIDLLNNKYGEININKLKLIFNNVNINNITFVQEKENSNPILNVELLNTIFGSNYHVQNTPIKILLENYDNIKISKNYLNNINLFFNYNFNECISNWELIKEEYIRKKQTSNLELRLNIETLNEICNYIKNTSRLSIDASDINLKNSDVFKYAGLDNQYVINYKLVPQRVITLSRLMNNVKYKTIPNISLEKDDYVLNTMNPQDRNILSLGYKTHNCFRPLGVADNYGNSNSLLQYVCENNNALVITITNKNNNVVSFSPVYRHGNVILINSIEGYELTDEEKITVNQIYREYANEVLKTADDNQDNIKFVFITSENDNLILDKNNINIPYIYHFYLYDPKCKYIDASICMDQYLLSGNNDLDEINYQIEPNKYYYEEYKDYKEIDFNKEYIKNYSENEDIKYQIIKISNSLINLNEKERYNRIKEINKLKKKYLINYKEITLTQSMANEYEDYKLLNSIIYQLSNKNIYNIKKGIFNNDFYIVVNINNELYFDFNQDGKEICLELIKKYEKEYKNENVRNNKRVK